MDFAQAPGGWRCLLTELEVVTDHADAEATEGGAVRAGADRLKREAIVGLYSFPIGSAVRVKPNVLEPRHQWGQVRPGSVGRMLGVSTNGYQVCYFNCRPSLPPSPLQKLTCDVWSCLGLARS